MSEPSLSARLAEASPRLSARVLEEMYANPFWQERFGDRGRRHSQKDGDYHLTYLAEALESGDDRVFASYARWLRDVLTARGMCSRHLAENYERLARAIEEEPWPDRGRAAAVLRVGVGALLHLSGDAGLLDARRSELAAAAAAAVHRVHPEWLERWGEAGRRRCEDDLEYHLSYLADALAAVRQEGFTAHVEFIAAMLERRGVPPGHLAETLRALAGELATVPGLTGRPAVWLDAAAAAISERASGGHRTLAEEVG